MPSSSQKSDLTSSLSKLSIDSSNKTPVAKKTKEPVADSWEDEDVDEEEDNDDDDREEREGAAGPQTDGSKAPPPTPISPTYSAADRSFAPYAAVDAYAPSAPAPAGGGNSGVRRPEKTDAVARRMIASALGVKVPRMTEEQRAYDKAVKEKERKRREEEKAAEKRRLEEAEKAKAAIWED
ncbi:hypothetical protein LZ30DRAFT_684193 [Colletotrichum cereale]|nr:hypothetical protein LZ30DRAFT_684193 [Colletotrichum cereale]